MGNFEQNRCLYNARASKLAIYGGVNVKRPKVTYEVLMAARKGDADAELAIMDAYEPYIIKLSSFPQYSRKGKLIYRIDRDLYFELKLKLHSLIMDFALKA